MCTVPSFTSSILAVTFRERSPSIKLGFLVSHRSLHRQRHKSRWPLIGRLMSAAAVSFRSGHCLYEQRCLPICCFKIQNIFLQCYIWALGTGSGTVAQERWMVRGLGKKVGCYLMIGRGHFGGCNATWDFYLGWDTSLLSSLRISCPLLCILTCMPSSALYPSRCTYTSKYDDAQRWIFQPIFLFLGISATPSSYVFCIDQQLESLGNRPTYVHLYQQYSSFIYHVCILIALLFVIILALVNLKEFFLCNIVYQQNWAIRSKLFT